MYGTDVAVSRTSHSRRTLLPSASKSHFTLGSIHKAALLSVAVGVSTVGASPSTAGIVTDPSRTLIVVSEGVTIRPRGSVQSPLPVLSSTPPGWTHTAPFCCRTESDSTWTFVRSPSPTIMSADITVAEKNDTAAHATARQSALRFINSSFHLFRQVKRYQNHFFFQPKNAKTFQISQIRKPLYHL